MFGLIQLASYKRSASNAPKIAGYCTVRGYLRCTFRFTFRCILRNTSRAISAGLILAIIGGCQSSDDPKAQMSQSDPLAVPALGNVEYHICKR